jgi:hypothetical protein
MRGNARPRSYATGTTAVIAVFFHLCVQKQSLVHAAANAGVETIAAVRIAHKTSRNPIRVTHMADTEHVWAPLSSFQRTGAYPRHWKGNDMDYSHILASQLINRDTSRDSEDAFYNALSLDGFARLRGTFQKLKTFAVRSVDVAQQVSRKRVRYTQSRDILDS